MKLKNDRGTPSHRIKNEGPSNRRFAAAKRMKQNSENKLLTVV